MNEPRGTQEQVAEIAGLLDPEVENEAEAGDEQQEGAGQPANEQASGEPLDESLGEGEEQGAGEAPEPQQAGEAGEIRTVADFAKAAGWSPEEFYGLTVRLDTGEEVPLGKVKDALQHYSRERADLDAAKQGLAQEYQKLQQFERQMVTGASQISQAVQEAQGRVVAAQERYNSINWEELAAQDPGKAAYLQQQISVEYAGAKADLQRVQQMEQGQRTEAMGRLMQMENEKFLQAVPEWRDPNVAAAQQNELNSFLIQQAGFQPQEVEQVFDARARVIALMALRWFKHATAVAGAAKQVRMAPKAVMKPANRQAPPAAERKVNALMQKAKTTQKRGDQVAAVSALLTQL